MKKLKFSLTLLIIFVFMTSCQQENILEDQANIVLEEQVDNAPNIQYKKKHPVPFHASVISNIVPPLPQPNPAICGSGFPLLNINQSFTGNATHMGNVSGTISSCLNVSTTPPSSTYVQITMMAANGDELNIEGAAGIFVINGGTGRFDDATGNLTGNFVPLGQGVFENFFDGEIQY